MYLSLPYLRDDQKERAKKHAFDQNNLIFGLNPYNTIMLEGIGQNYSVYDEGSGQVIVRGGICIGITAGFENENDIAFMPLPQNDDMNHKWRWAEQWTLYGAWVMLAIASMEN